VDIYIDWDIDFRYRERYYKYLKEAVEYLKEAGVRYKLYERRSASGNTHIMISIDKQVNFLTQLTIRALARDDAYRLAVDIIRYTKKGVNEVNRLFEVKAVKGKIKRAGKWREIKRL
jgi:hypothetical protein